MNQELAISLLCIVMRNGAELWLEADRVKALQARLKEPDCPRFVNFDGQTINTADVVGVFTPQTMEAITRRKNGQWQCKFGHWHDRKEVCECRPVVGKVHYKVPELGIEFDAGKKG